jgi:NAD(P)-dependent dehydrogenase (short-subunit alcohol dehydrogenase family)/uncharacterized OB-fold protein
LRGSNVGERLHLNTSPPHLPPYRRSRVALRMTASAAIGRFELQRCARCGAVQYPPRESCHRCLSVDLVWTIQSGEGRLISETTLFHSNQEYFRERLPWRLGLIKLGAGPVVVAHLHRSAALAPCDVKVTVWLDRAGQAALIATGPEEGATLQDDPRFFEMSSDPRDRRILITDGTSAVGQSLVGELIAAGAKHIWVGQPPGKSFRPIGIDDDRRLSIVPIDVRSIESTQLAAREFGHLIDVLINSSVYEHAENDISSPAEADPLAQLQSAGQKEMEINYFGLLRLSDAFAGLLRAQAGAPLPAWLNLFSICALVNWPRRSTFSASLAAAHSFSQGLRARLRPAGVRVINVFPGPMPPKVLARSVVLALREGAEDVYPGDIAQDCLAKWLESPKALEREMADQPDVWQG